MIKRTAFFCFLGAAAFAQSEQDLERKAKSYSKNKQDLVVWMKVEGGYSQVEIERNRKYPFVAVYGDGTVIRNSGENYYKATLKEEDMVKFLLQFVKEGFGDLRPPDGLPLIAENRKETIGIKIDYKTNEFKIPSKLNDLAASRPNDERLQKVKKVRDLIANYWPPNSAKCDPAKEFDGRSK